MNDGSKANAGMTARSLLDEAVRQRATDIHIDHIPGETVIRFRVNADLLQAGKLPKQSGEALCASLKDMVGISSYEDSFRAQSVPYVAGNGKHFQLRALTVPTIYGESIVMRLITEGSMQVSLSDIFGEKDTQLLSSAVGSRKGVLFITGPAGSGKSTVLYALLNEVIMQTPHRKLHSVVENPVDFVIKGLVQTEVRHQEGMTRPQVLRHLLLCDPDVIVVPSFPDRETAEVLFTTSLALRLAISRLHADSACDALHRLLAMGVDRQLLVDAAPVFFCVRTVRTLCPNCKEQTVVSPEKLKHLCDPRIAANDTAWQAVGCTACDNVGYTGRIGSLETLRVQGNVAQAVQNANAPCDLRQEALESGMRTFGESLMDLIMDGVTSIDEAVSVYNQSMGK